MAELIRSVEDEVPISYGRFDLLDASGLGAEAEPEEAAGALLAEPGQVALGQVGVRSQAWAWNARVRMEAWDAEPPPPGEPWTEAGQVLYLSPGGIVGLCGLMRAPSGQRLLLGPPFFAYGLRAYAGPVRTEPVDGDESVTEAVEEAWLLRFWPLADTAGPALGAESEAGGMAAARMREVLPLDPGSAAPRPEEWPALRPLPRPAPAMVIRWSYPAEDLPDGDAERRFTVPQETRGSWRRLDETLGDLRIDMLGNLPAAIGSWSQEELERYATQLRVSRRIGAELNPHRAPTLRLEEAHVRTVLIGPYPGFSGRAWVWASGENAHSDALSLDREVVARDRIRRGTLLTGIVTILRNENGFVEVRAATDAEAARVLGVERLRG
ncbi:hypothetical protein IL992_40795 [Microbispora sp. NEAU-D428]|uniref:hypothetical protein n=1 Tax=Microbispora sitophila TaxID=2771537 RepID=UPI00186727D3|nr:hypothetical protein [Microbispora sitophila]MBE3015450.1 hypothetical protein [Microbispora sitophila]MBE3015458.1 hypothetical protein [Microbispora sitophila]